jgi:hypothetical protein
MHSVNGADDLEAIWTEEPPGPASGAPRARRVVAWVGILVLAGGAFLLGRASSDEVPPLPPCGERALGLIEADGLPDAALRVLAPLRPTGPGDGPLPLPGSLTVEVTGVAEGEDIFRPRGGRLAVAVELPRSSIGRTARIESPDGRMLVAPRISSPLCGVERAALPRP